MSVSAPVRYSGTVAPQTGQLNAHLDHRPQPRILNVCPRNWHARAGKLPASRPGVNRARYLWTTPSVCRI
jgi:hypothetical protein